MRRPLLPLNALRAFESAARHLSFRQAAGELHVTQAAVSHQVRQLEEFLGVKLFRRLPRSLRLTDAGRQILPDLHVGFSSLSRAIDRIGPEEAHGRLVLSSITTFALCWLVPRIARFKARWPNIELSLNTTLQLTDFSREDVDTAIRYGRGPYAGLQCDKLFDNEVTPLCSPALARRIKRPEHLRLVPLLPLNNNDDDWASWLSAAGAKCVTVPRGAGFDSTAVAVDAAIAGMGVAIANPYVHHRELRKKLLVQKFDLVVPNGRSYWLVCPQATSQQPKIRAFRDWILHEAAVFENGRRVAL